jgi:hypothetical protein
MSDPTEPVAYRVDVNHPINTFALVVRQEVEGVLDYIISTFILLEQGMRMGEKRSDVADGMVCQNRTLLGYTNVNSLSQ